MRIGFIGLGRKGVGGIASLLKAGHEVTVYEPSPRRSRALTAKGAKTANSVAAACCVDALVTWAFNEQTLEQMTLGPGGVVQSLAPGMVHVCIGTIGSALSQRLCERHAGAGQLFVSAPGLRTGSAEAERLAVAAGGQMRALCIAVSLLALLAGPSRVRRRSGWAIRREVEGRMPRRAGVSGAPIATVTSSGRRGNQRDTVARSTARRNPDEALRDALRGRGRVLGYRGNGVPGS